MVDRDAAAEEGNDEAPLPHILDAKRLQNVSIALATFRKVSVQTIRKSVEQCCTDSTSGFELTAETVAVLQKMAPTPEECSHTGSSRAA